MAHTKAGGSTKLGRDSQGQRLGTKASDGQVITAGSLLVRQRGTRYDAGENVRVAKDHTLFATSGGTVRYTKRNKTTFAGSKKRKTVISVEAGA
jgi:large subunit ribosomal protein L27